MASKTWHWQTLHYIDVFRRESRRGRAAEKEEGTGGGTVRPLFSEPGHPSRRRGPYLRRVSADAANRHLSRDRIEVRVESEGSSPRVIRPRKVDSGSSAIGPTESSSVIGPAKKVPESRGIRPGWNRRHGTLLDLAAPRRPDGGSPRLGRSKVTTVGSRK